MQPGLLLFQRINEEKVGLIRFLSASGVLSSRNELSVAVAPE